MGAPQEMSAQDLGSALIGRLAVAGVKLSADGPDLLAEPRAALTDELRALIRANKSVILGALAEVERGREGRHQKALMALAAQADKQRVAIFAPDPEREYVLCTIAIRGVGTCELRIPRGKYDPWAILNALERAEQ
jgi:TubC N-terminal docking domain